jgi:hypothetical protein
VRLQQGQYVIKEASEGSRNGGAGGGGNGGGSGVRRHTQSGEHANGENHSGRKLDLHGQRKITPQGFRVMANALEATLEDTQDEEGMRVGAPPRPLPTTVIGDNIVWLDLAFCEQLDSGSLGRLSQCCPVLQRISLAGCQRVTDKGTCCCLLAICCLLSAVCCLLFALLSHNCNSPTS